jgi:hypothetical protein
MEGDDYPERYEASNPYSDCETPSEKIRGTRINVLLELAGFREVIMRMARAVVSGYAWNRDDEDYFFGLYQNNRAHLYLRQTFGNQSEGGRRVVVEELLASSALPLIHEIGALFIDALAKDNLSCCPECGNIYPQTRPSRQYCSDRCSGVARTRKSRANKK